MKHLALALAAFRSPAAAHAGEPLEPHDLLTLQAWVFDPYIVLPLILAAVLYQRGSSRARGIRRWEASCYWAGWAMLVLALVSPLHAMGEVLFSAHMTQHELMMLVAAPLIVIGRPLVPYVWALPDRWRKPIARPILSVPVQRAWRFLSNPLHAFWLHGVALWAWHVPVLYQATVSSDVMHSAQHSSFLITALLFWWSLLKNPRVRSQYGLAAVYVFGTALHSSILGALLTFANTVWYPVYAETTWAWGLTALEDQQLGGLIMWVPAGLLYTVAGLALVAAWLRESERRLVVSKPAALVLVLAGVLVTSSCASTDGANAANLTGGDPKRGPALIGYYGCASCHEIPGVRGADGLVGPSLRRIAVRSYIAGMLPNTSDNMMRWIRHPQEVDERTMMPEMNVTEEDARDIAAFLYTLR
jgi:cytochrome c oxidase assembly factor CtaG/cytochrome c551/c552